MQRGVVVITGAGSGIGWASARALAAHGYTVLAGALDADEVDDIRGRGVEGVTSIVLDVTSAEQIAAAAARADELGPLRGLVNSAGIAVAGPLEFLPDDDLRLQLDVNVLGLMAVTRAFMPGLRRSGGRVINIGSVGGRLSIPFTGPYCASKFAVRALSDALRMELRPSGVGVVLIEPGPIATPIWERSIDAGSRRLERLPPEARRRYDDQIERVFSVTRKMAAQSIPVDRVVAAVRRALESRRPPPQILVGAQAHLQAWAARLPTRLRELAILRVMGLPTRRGS